MLNNNLFQLSEDDIRTKVVYQWLRDCGFNNADIIIEYSIKLRLGRGIKTINSRTDVLVKSVDGLNLLIIEVKRPNHPLNKDDKKQALSYARSLSEGGIAPFTILTNGDSVIIFDSVSGNEIIGNIIPSNHPYVENGFRVSGDSLLAKAEALEYLISLSSENLLTFCKAQVQYRMELLKSKDLFSGKKYIPQLYVNRKKAREELDKKLFGDSENQPNQVVLIIGAPQHGKTCFLCNTIESYIEKEIPVLFYPAISLKNGLLIEIQEDFEWYFGNQTNSFQLINKLRHITQQTQKEIIVFVDGWNEMIEQALIINDECRRLQQDRIKIVLSTTSPSIGRLLQDEAANLTFIAGKVKLNATAIQTLTTKPLVNTNGISIVQIGEFDNSELKKGRLLHEQAYNTKFTNNSNIPKDPFYLRLAAEVYTNNSVPIFATRTQLIKMGLFRKAARRGIHEMNLVSTLNDVAAIILEKDSPFCCIDLPFNLRSEEVLSHWIESAIFIRLYEKEIPEVDFYYSHEKDYSIAILNRRFHEVLIGSNAQTIYNELQYSLKTESGQSALRWFLSCPEYSSILKNIFILLTSEITINNTIAKILTDSILKQVNLNNNYSYNWLDEYISNIISTQTNHDEFCSNLVSLIYSLLKSFDKDKEKKKYEFWMKLLVKYDNSSDGLGIEESLVCQYYGVDDFKTYGSEELETTLDIEFFEKLILNEDIKVTCNATKFLTNASYLYMLACLPFFIKYYQENNRPGIEQILENSCFCILYELCENYYGGICPGMLSDAEKGNEMIIEEYLNIQIDH